MIYVVRHGQTEGNLTSIVRGKRFDDNLNEVGIAQARQVAKQLEGIVFDACYCSPLARTRQTLEIIYDTHGANKITDERLLPRDYAGFTGGNISDLNKEELWERNDRVGSGMESILSFEKRVFDFFDDIVKKHKGKDVLVVTHASTCRMVRGYISGIPTSNNYMQYPITKNCEILEVKN